MALKLVSHRLLLIKTFKNSLQFQNILNVSRQVDFETRYRHLSTTKRIIQAPCTALSPQIKDYFDYPQSAKEKVNPILQSLELYLDFVDEQEELELLSQIDKTIGRRRYEDSHWDYAILQFREIECRTWSDHNRPIIERMKTQAFREGHPSLSYVPTIQDSDTKEQPKIESVGQDIRPIAEVHVLDLAADGCIKPHVDAVRFCGPIIGGLSLGSDCVMRFARSTKPDEYVDVWLPRRSFYVMSGFSRYECTHEIFPSTDSKFKGQPIAKSRRVSLLTRCHPLS